MGGAKDVGGLVEHYEVAARFLGTQVFGLRCQRGKHDNRFVPCLLVGAKAPDDGGSRPASPVATAP